MPFKPIKLVQSFEVLFPNKDLEIKCCFPDCNNEFGEFGHNPKPYVVEGRCCEECYTTNVIPVREDILK